MFITIQEVIYMKVGGCIAIDVEERKCTRRIKYVYKI